MLELWRLIVLQQIGKLRALLNYKLYFPHVCSEKWSLSNKILAFDSCLKVILQNLDLSCLDSCMFSQSFLFNIRDRAF